MLPVKKSVSRKQTRQNAQAWQACPQKAFLASLPCPTIKSLPGPTVVQRAATGIGQAECVKSTGTIARPARRVVCVVLRVADDPLPIPPGLLRRRNLHRLVGIVLHVADREPLGLDLLPHFLLSHLECIRFRSDSPSFLMANCSPRYLTPRAWPQLARLAAPSALLQRLPCHLIRSHPGAS
jgi:hypothetical protein